VLPLTGVLSTILTAFVHTGVQRASRQRFEQATTLEIALIDLLRETDPDIEKVILLCCISAVSRSDSRMTVTHTHYLSSCVG